MNDSPNETQLDLFGSEARELPTPIEQRGEPVWRCLCDRPLREARGKLVCEVTG